MSAETTTLARREKMGLRARLLIHTDVRLLTGLHVGGTPVGIEIGGMNNPIIRNPFTNRPYLPGSSLRGKMRSLLEKYYDLRFNQKIQDVYIHGYDKDSDEMSEICYIFGVSGDVKKAQPTRLFVRDAGDLCEFNPSENYDEKTAPPSSFFTPADDDSRRVEVKWEAAIDRVTSAAVPRQQERISAGLFFRQVELVFNFYTDEDYARFETVLLGLRLLEDDYLGGGGSRGSGKIEFKYLNFILRPAQKNDLATYLSNDPKYRKFYKDLDTTLTDRQGLLDWLKANVKKG
jgi:CRISPR-associated protein Csm3